MIWVPFHCRDLEIKLRFNGTHITLEWVKRLHNFKPTQKNKMGPPLLHLLSSIKCFLLDHMTSSRHVIQAKIFLMIVSYIYKCAFWPLKLPNVSGALYMIYRLADFLNNYLPSESYKWLIVWVEVTQKYPAIRSNIYIKIQSFEWKSVMIGPKVIATHAIYIFSSLAPQYNVNTFELKHIFLYASGISQYHFTYLKNQNCFLLFILELSSTETIFSV